jgi:CHAD domain-containing protein
MSRKSTAYVRKQTSSIIDKLSAHAAEAQSDPTPDAVHDIRVAIRRFKAALRTFRPELPAGGVRKVRAELDRVMEAAGPVRDLDVALELLAAARLPTRSPLLVEIRSRRETGAKALRKLAPALSHAGKLNQKLGI